MISRISPTVAAVMAGVAASLVPGSTPAMAQESTAQIIVQGPTANIRGERVPYYDLNLATRAGEQALYRRVSNAVEHVCLHDEGRWYGMTQPDFIGCTEGAWRSARPQMVGAIFRARQLAYRQH